MSCSQCSLCLWIVFDLCALFVFALCLVPSVPCVSGLSILDYSFCFFPTFIVYLFPMQLLTRVIFLRMILFTKKLCNSYIIPGTNYNNLINHVTQLITSLLQEKYCKDDAVDIAMLHSVGVAIVAVIVL